MYIDFSGLFHQSSKDRSGKGHVSIPFDPALWPPEWKTISYKEYPRFNKIALEHEQPQGDLFDTLRRRTSRRDFDQKPMVKEAISNLLKYSCGIMSDDEGAYHRAQPSGGGRYPIEVYPVFFIPSEGIPAGVYHYNVKNHALDTLWKRSFTKEDLATFFTYPWAQEASFALLLTGVFSRNQMKYGERGYRHILVETGAIVQNIYLTATKLGIKCCAIDGVDELNLEKLLDIDGFSESVLCSLVLG